MGGRGLNRGRPLLSDFTRQLLRQTLIGRYHLLLTFFRPKQPFRLHHITLGDHLPLLSDEPHRRCFFSLRRCCCRWKHNCIPASYPRSAQPQGDRQELISTVLINPASFLVSFLILFEHQGCWVFLSWTHDHREARKLLLLGCLSSPLVSLPPSCLFLSV